MSKKVTITTGIFVWIVTPILLAYIYDINLTQMLKSFFSIIHLFALLRVFHSDYQSRIKIQKILIFVAFLVYPLILTADSTQMFDKKTFIVAIITGWIYMMGVAGWLYTEKQSLIIKAIIYSLNKVVDILLFDI